MKTLRISGAGVFAFVLILFFSTGCELPVTYSIGGTVSGLNGGTLELSLNGIDTYSTSSNGAYKFQRKLLSNASYSVEITQQPNGQSCSPELQEGAVVDSDVTDINISCVDKPGSTSECEIDDVPSNDPCECTAAGQIPKYTACEGSPIARCWGDPHLVTFDQLAYDFQGAGEYILTQSTQDDLQVQGRFVPWSSWRHVSVTKAIAVNLEGDEVGLFADRPNPLYVNGASFPLLPGVNVLPGGGLIEASLSGYNLAWLDGSILRVTDRGSYLNCAMQAHQSRANLLTGLWGNFNGVPGDDITSSSNVNIPLPPNFDQLYHQFGDSWRITQATSLFAYINGNSTATYTNTNFPAGPVTVNSLSATQRAAALAICEAANISDPILLDACILDVALTGDNSFADPFADNINPPAAQATVLALALQLDGVDDYVQYPVTLEELGLGSAFTLAIWLNTSDIDLMQTILEDGSQASSSGLSLGINTAQEIVSLRVNTDSGNIDDNAISVPGLGSGWMNLAISYDGSMLHLYLDGSLVYSQALSGNLSPGDQNLRLGYASADNFFAGKVDDLKIWNIALSETDIASEMSKAAVGNESGLVGYWPFDDGAGTQVRDLTSKVNHGTLVGSPTWSPDVPDGVSLNYGEVVAAELSVVGESDVYTFAAVAGDIVRVRAGDLSGSTSTHASVVTLFDPNGVALDSTVGAYYAQLDVPLATSGTYTIHYSDDNDDQTGNYWLSLQRLNPPDDAVPVTYGEVVSASIDQAMEMDAYSFDATAGDVVRLRGGDLSGSTNTQQTIIEVFDASGTLLYSGSQPYYVELNMSLDETGSYSILVSDEYGNHTGNYWLSLQQLNPPVAAVPIAYGEVVSASLDQPMEMDAYSFNATAGDVVRLRGGDLSGSTNTQQTIIEVFDASGTLLYSGNQPYYVELNMSLDETGSYSILVSDEYGNHTGNYWLSIERLNPPLVAVPIGYGEVVSASLDQPMEMDAYSFSAASGDVVRLRGGDLSGSTNTQQTIIEVFDASGTLLYSGNQPYYVELNMSFDETGSYSILVTDEYGNHTGNYWLSIERLNPPIAATSIAYGEVVMASLDQPMEMDAYSFDAMAGDVVRLRGGDLSGSTNTQQTIIEVFDGSGTLLYSGSHPYDVELTLNLSVAGSYTILVTDEYGNHTGNYWLSIQRLNPPVGALTLAYDDVIAASLDQAMEMDAYSFTANDGDTVRIQAGDGSGSTNTQQTIVEVFDSNGNLVASGTHPYDLILDVSISTSGSYSILYTDQYGNHTGSYTIGVSLLP